MSLCERCGATTADETALFCGACGAALPKLAPPPAPPPEPAPAPEQARDDEPPPTIDDASLPPVAGSPAARPKGTIPAAPISEALKPIPEAPAVVAAAPAPPVFVAAPAPAAEPPRLSGGVVLAPPAGAPSGGAAPVKAPKHLPAGALVDQKYAILRVVGEGGMGVVYLARDIHTGLDVVVKAVRSELAHRQDVRARTLAEGRALAQIDHPNVVHLRAVVVEGPALYLVMQHIDGETLDRLIAGYLERGAAMPVDEALGIFRQIVAGVGAAHLEGVVHRDLKPANVLVRKKDGVAKVTDFGIALVPQERDRPQTRGIVGSLWYMSPEQVTGRRDLDHRVDVYALGILLYQMLVGRVPFDAKSDYDIMRLHAEAPMPRIAEVRPDVPMLVDEIVQRACAKDRERRFQTCEELMGAVDRLLLMTPGPPGVARMSGPGVSAMQAATFPGAGPRASRPGPAPPLVQAATLAVAGLAEPSLPSGQGTASMPPAPSMPGAPSLPVVSGMPSLPVVSGVPSLPSLPGLPSMPSLTPQPAAAPARRRVWPWVLGALVVLGGAGAGVALGFGLVPGVKGIWKVPTLALWPSGSASAGPRGSSAPRASASTSASAGRPASGLEALAGAWVGNGRELDAALSGEGLEFRVKKPEQFSPQSYEPGEARFVLRATAEPNVFAVEDRIRPVPPVGKTYDPRSRGTCQEVWTAIGAEPLRARWDGARLTVEFAKIEPGPANFTIEGAKVTSCVGLRDVKASKVVSVLQKR